MEYDPEILRLARREQEKRVLEHKRQRGLLRERLYEKAPELRTLSLQIRDVFLDALSRLSPEAFAEASKLSLALQKERAERLLALGARADDLDELPCCICCEDKGRVGGKLCDCVAEQYRRLQARFLSSLLDLNGQSFESFDSARFSEEYDPHFGGSPRENIELVRDICQNFSSSFSGQSDNLVFSGPPGTGKTFMAACIAGAVASRGFSVVYDTAARQLRGEEALHFGRAGEEGELQARRLRSCDLLLIDDLGAEFLTPFAQSALLDIVNMRLVSRKKTVISTNLSRQDLASRYSPALVSRLTGRFIWLHFIGGDLRTIES